MDTVRISAVEEQLDSATVLKPLSRPLNTSNLSINYYELAPGDSFAYGYHVHENQEEVFVIQQGTVTFDTETGEIPVAAGEAVRFAPGEYQQGINRGSDRVIAFGLGAPRDAGTSDIRRECPQCGERTPNTIDRVDDGAAKITRCLDCGAETARFEWGRD